MHLTNRQKFLLSHLDQIVGRTRASGRQGFFLAHEDCTTTINSLIVKGMVRANEARTRLVPGAASQPGDGHAREARRPVAKQDQRP